MAPTPSKPMNGTLRTIKNLNKTMLQVKKSTEFWQTGIDFLFSLFGDDLDNLSQEELIERLAPVIAANKSARQRLTPKMLSVINQKDVRKAARPTLYISRHNISSAVVDEIYAKKHRELMKQAIEELYDIAYGDRIIDDPPASQEISVPIPAFPSIPASFIPASIPSIPAVIRSVPIFPSVSKSIPIVVKNTVVPASNAVTPTAVTPTAVEKISSDASQPASATPSRPKNKKSAENSELSDKLHSIIKKKQDKRAPKKSGGKKKN